ncbi:probable trehalose-phosphate phosphatase F isoform X2 [Spinacia oleracea]|uniref:Probable trehalose-phosphate phosphatase F isoform X2 n=1 Tax=Spinacia oleracea TaxID=3562 RepID=A0ABM3RLT7_SPIOL|nr:probable trehalose-phosphate phosphatase F isoform X2 [Spinacia oleracea]
MDIMSPVHKVCNGHSNTNESTDKQDKEVSLFQPASEFLPMIDEVFRTLVDKTKGIKGVNVEIYKFFSYVHYRNVDEKNWPTIAQLVHQVLKSFPRLRLTHGCKATSCGMSDKLAMFISKKGQVQKCNPILMQRKFQLLSAWSFPKLISTL